MIYHSKYEDEIVNCLYFVQKEYSVYIDVYENECVCNVFKNREQVLNVCGTIWECLTEINKLIYDTRKS